MCNNCGPMRFERESFQDVCSWMFLEALGFCYIFSVLRIPSVFHIRACTWGPDIGSCMAMSGRHFQEQHARRVGALADRLHEALVLPDGGEYLATTGSLLGSSNLRTEKSKQAFRIILQASSDCCSDDANARFWTKRTLKDALRSMVQRHNLSMPQLCGFTFESWFDQQTSTIHALCKRAHRNFKGPMDSMETQAQLGIQQVCTDIIETNCTL